MINYNIISRYLSSDMDAARYSEVSAAIGSSRAAFRAG